MVMWRLFYADNRNGDSNRRLQIRAFENGCRILIFLLILQLVLTIFLFIMIEHGFDFFYSVESIILTVSIILFFSILAGKAGYRFGIPVLLVFLGVGMLFGTDGLGIEFDSHETVQFIGMFSLSIILFSGGMDTRINEIRPILAEGTVLATLGVLLTTAVTGGFIYLLFSLIPGFETLSVTEALLLAAVMSSTDSASVFSILRSKNVFLKERLRPTLEMESGSNDPMAYMLTVLLISYVKVEGGVVWYDAAISFAVQMVLGAAGGYLLGLLAVRIINRINIGNDSLYPILLMTIVFFIFASVSLCKGNGYLAVYIAGLTFGNRRHIHRRSISTFFDGFTWLCQIIIFLMLGLLVNPHELLPVAAVGLSVGLFLMFVARPLSVFICLAPFKSFSTRAKAYISWVGLRGAVPIIFATYPMIEGLEHANIFFNIVFFITILSLLVQGTTVTYAAKLLKLDDVPAKKVYFDIELPEDIKSAMSEITVTQNMLQYGNKLMDIKLPDNTLVVMVKRGQSYFIPRGNTVFMENDKLLLISDNDEELVRAYSSMGVKDYTLKKNQE